ncbi:sulfur oxidation c-type cytochrome SoxA [Thiohalomonas denitrificans]|uniref:sulfur oxidation c-type cytochrome SoxA n=1 Tax=Thiohalomonas denitrificans TaxID=415747 RepID=UPI0026E9C487|nr:sulfur oxidation c-type cytochrome SoxA [Thiohalomonas denitrificans]
MMKPKAMFVALAGIFAASAWAVETEDRYPRTPIVPEQGVWGDQGFSNTIQYWGSKEALNKNASLQDDPDNVWKLNHKHKDGDRVDMHPGHIGVEEGREMVDSWSSKKPEFLKCLSEGKGSLQGLAANYPKYDEKLDRIMTVEARIEHCSQTHLPKQIKQGSPANTTSALYVKSLSAGKPIQVDLSSAPVEQAYQRGEKLFYKRIGQLNFACASCHTPGSVMGHKLRGEVPTTPFGDVAHYPTYRTPVGELEPLHLRFVRCHKQMRAKPLPPGDPAYTDLEVFLSVLSNDYPISVPSLR